MYVLYAFQISKCLRFLIMPISKASPGWRSAVIFSQEEESEACECLGMAFCLESQSQSLADIRVGRAITRRRNNHFWVCSFERRCLTSNETFEGLEMLFRELSDMR